MNKYLMIPASVVVTGMAIAVILMGVAKSPAEASSRSTPTNITVYGTNTTMLTPTVAEVSLGITSQETTAQAALSTNNRITHRVIMAIEHLGISPHTITTSALNVSPQYSNGNPNLIQGYQVSDMITINAEVSIAGKIIDQGVAAGANQVNGVNFSLSPNSASYESLYSGALHNARTQANAIATSMHETIVGVISITMENQTPGIVGTVYNAVPDVASAPVMPGQQQQAVRLKVVYRLNG